MDGQMGKWERGRERVGVRGEGRKANMDERQTGVHPTGHEYSLSAGLGVREQVKILPF